MKCACDDCKYKPISCEDKCQREYDNNYYRGAREFAKALRVNFDLLAWNNSDEVIDYTLAEWQKGRE